MQTIEPQINRGESLVTATVRQSWCAGCLACARLQQTVRTQQLLKQRVCLCVLCDGGRSQQKLRSRGRKESPKMILILYFNQCTTSSLRSRCKCQDHRGGSFKNFQLNLVWHKPKSHNLASLSIRFRPTMLQHIYTKDVRQPIAVTFLFWVSSANFPLLLIS